jgi:feruloyl-CoA synthase
VTRVTLRDGATGTHYLSADQALQPYPDRLTDRLRQWAEACPDRTWMAQRRAAPAPTAAHLGDWRHVSYREAWDTARRWRKPCWTGA